MFRLSPTVKVTEGEKKLWTSLSETVTEGEKKLWTSLSETPGRSTQIREGSVRRSHSHLNISFFFLISNIWISILKTCIIW